MKYIKAIHPQSAWYVDRKELVGAVARHDETTPKKGVGGWMQGYVMVNTVQHYFYGVKFTSVKPKKVKK